MTPIGILENITSLIWTRHYWSSGTFSLLAPFTPQHAKLLQKYNLIIKRDGDGAAPGQGSDLAEAAEIRYINIRKNAQGYEEIEVQGRFITNWLGKRIITEQINSQDTTQNIIYRIVRENIIEPQEPAEYGAPHHTLEPPRFNTPRRIYMTPLVGEI